MQVAVTLGEKRGIATVEWEASPAGDILADSVVALLMHAQSSAASIRLTSKPCRHPRDSDIESEQAEKKQRANDDDDIVTSRLRFFHSILKEQFENVEGIYEGRKATFEIQTDAGLESNASDDDGILRCSVDVEFLDANGHDAKISVESKDEKMARNIQDCLQSAAATANPIAL